MFITIWVGYLNCKLIEVTNSYGYKLCTMLIYILKEYIVTYTILLYILWTSVWNSLLQYIKIKDVHLISSRGMVATIIIFIVSELFQESVMVIHLFSILSHLLSTPSRTIIFVYIVTRICHFGTKQINSWGF